MNCDETSVGEARDMLQAIDDTYVTWAVCRYGQKPLLIS